MNKDRGLIGQGAARIGALTLPLLVVMGVRFLAPAHHEQYFFEILTDVVLLAALLKVGVDAYVPGCRLQGASVLVASTWWKVWRIVSIILVASAVVLYAAGGRWGVPMATALVLAGFLAAEIDRLRQQYVTFYLFKVPGAYLAALFIAFGVGRSIGLDLVIAIVFLAPVALVAVRVVAVDDEIDSRKLMLGGVVSLLFVAFSWKEALAARWVFGGEDLPEVVFFSRLLQIVTFVYMLRNARVPVVMRNESKLGVRPNIYAVSGRGRLGALAWALVSSAFVIGYAMVFEPNKTLGTASLMAGGCVLVAVGNMTACLVYLREYTWVLIINVGALLVFGITLLMSTWYISDIFLAVSVSSLCAQLAFAALTLQAVNNVDNKEMVLTER